MINRELYKTKQQDNIDIEQEKPIEENDKRPCIMKVEIVRPTNNMRRKKAMADEHTNATAQGTGTPCFGKVD